MGHVFRTDGMDKVKRRYDNARTQAQKGRLERQAGGNVRLVAQVRHNGSCRYRPP